MPHSDAQQKRPPRVLIVDDEPTILAQLEAFFKNSDAPFEREYASSGTGALARVETRCYEACLLDLDMPDMTGGGAAMLIHKFDPSLPIAFFTNHTREAVEHLLALIPISVYWYKLDRVGAPERLVAEILDLAADPNRCDADPVTRKASRSLGDAPHYPLVTEVLDTTAQSAAFKTLVSRAAGGAV